jgi:hypothetical protein
VPDRERTIPGVSEGERERGGEALAVAGPVDAGDADEARTLGESPEMAALASLVTATGRARTVEEVGEAALDILCRATGADSGLVASSDGAFEPIATKDANPATIDLLRSLGGPGESTTRELQAPDAFISADVASAPLAPEVRAALAADGLRHVVGVGLHVPGRLIGGLALGWREVPRPAPSKGVLLQAAALIAAAIENARLIALIERGLAEERLLTRRMRALVELTRLPTVSPAGEHPLEGLLAEVNAVIGAAGSVICEVEGDWLRPLAAANLQLDRIAGRWRAGSAATVPRCSCRSTTPA